MQVTGTLIPYLSSYAKIVNFAFFDGSTEIDIQQFNASYAGKDVYANILKLESGEVFFFTDAVFSSDGLKAFTFDRYVNKKIYSFQLTDPYELTTGVNQPSSLDLPSDLDVSKKMNFYLAGDFLFLGDDAGKVVRFSGASNFEVSELTNDGVTDTSGGNTSRNGFSFSADGSKFFFMVGDEIRQVNLSTAFDLTTGDFNSSSLAYSINGTVFTDANFCLSPNGAHAFFIGATGAMNILDMSTPFDLSTVSVETSAENSVNGGQQLPVPENLTFIPENDSYALNAYLYGYIIKYRFKYQPLALGEPAKYFMTVKIGEHSALSFNPFGFDSAFTISAIRDGEIKSFVCQVRIKDPDGNPYFIAFSGTATNTNLADIYIQNPTVSTNDEIEIDTFAFIFNGQT